MADNEDYVERDAVVRMPKTGRLAASRKTEGWSRGFTAKSSSRGPEHVEIRLKDRGGLPSTHEPEVVHAPAYVDNQRPRELTEEELQLVATLLCNGFIWLTNVAVPRATKWWGTTVAPTIVAKRDGFTLKRRTRTAERQPLSTLAPTPLDLGDRTAEETPSRVPVVADGPSTEMTSEQFMQLFMTFLAREDAQLSLWQALTNAKIKDQDAATLALLHRLNELSPEQGIEHVRQVLSENPSIRAAIAPLRMEHRPVELGSIVHRPDQA